jgi:fibronectin-binding autotransporter adhesin
VAHLNFVGTFDAKLPVDGAGAHSDAHVHVDAVTAAHVPLGAIIVPDAQLLFTGDFKRAGVDLILSNDGHELVLHDYFKGEKRATLASPDGAHLTGDLVNALTGHVEYAQADGSAGAGKIIGHVTKLAGSATAVRNGVSIILNQGDNVEKGDVVQSGSGSTVGITFIDGTVFGLSSNARMVLNEMVYDPNGSNNSSLMSLVAGTISFVAGETAKHGDMKVDTPVATMGIRGTAVLVEIDFDVPGQGNAPDAKFQVLVEPDGTTGSYILYDKTTLAPIATVNQAGQQINISQGVVSQTVSGLSADVQKLITEVFAQKFTDNTNTKTFDHFTDTPIPVSLTPVMLANGATATPIVLLVTPPSNAGSGPSNGPNNSIVHIDQAPTAVAFGDSVVERPGVTHSSAPDTASGIVRFVDINAGDTPTVKTTFGSYAYQNAQHADVTATLTAQQIADITAVEAKLTVVADAGNTNGGFATWTYSVADGALDFLAAGETLTLTYVAEVDSNFAPNNLQTFKTFTVTITGTNDVPVITTGPETVAYSGGKTTPGGNLPTIGQAPTTGTLAFADVDLTDTHTVATLLTDASMSGPGATTLDMAALDALAPAPMAAFEQALTAKILAGNDSTGSGTGTINWQLADLPVYLADFIPVGETLTLTYTVTVTDSQKAVSTPQTVTVTITGTAAAAEVWIDTSPVPSSGALWSDVSNWETGRVPTATDDVIIITNQLLGLTPSYPVTINAPAFANSVTMNDFPAIVVPPAVPSPSSAPVLINLSTLTIGGAFDLNADSDVENSGTISVGGLMEVLDTSVLNNSGHITLGLGGDFKNQSTITNTITGAIEISGGTLNVQVDIANSGHITVDGTATLALSGAAIDGGTVTNNAGGILNLTGAAVLKNGSLGNAGQINVSGTGNALDNESVTSNHGLEILAAGALTLDLATTIANASGTITVDATATLTMNDASITDGTLTNGGTVNSIGTDVITHAAITNTSILEATAGVLTISSSGGVTLTNSGTLEANGGELDITGEPVTNTGTLQATDNSILKLTTTTVTNTDGETNGTVTIDLGSTLDLVSATIIDGTLTNHGTLDATGASAITDVGITNTGTIEATSGILTIDPAIAGVTLINSGTLEANGGELDITGDPVINTGILQSIDNSILKLTSLMVTNTGGKVTVGVGSTLALVSAIIIEGTLTNHGTIDIEAGASNPGATLDGVAVTDFSAVTAPSATPTSTIKVGATSAATLLLDDATTITDGALSIGSGSTLDIEAGASGPGATLDGVSVIGINAVTGEAAAPGSSITVGGSISAILTLDDGTTITGGSLTVGLDSTVEIAPGSTDIGATLIGVSVSNSGSILVGNVAVLDPTLTLADGTAVTGGKLFIGSGDTLDIEHGAHGSGATLDGVTVTAADSTATIKVGVDGAATLLLDDATSITDGTLSIGSGSTLDIEQGTSGSGVTLDGVKITGVDAGTGPTPTPASSIEIGVSGAGTLTLDDGTSITGGTMTIGSLGVLDISHGTVTLDDLVVSNSGKIEVDSGATLVVGAKAVISGPVTATIANGGSADFIGSATETLTLNATFSGVGTLELDHSQNYHGTIIGFGAGTVIDLSDLAYSATETDVWNNATHTLTITDGTQITSLKLAGDFNQNDFALAEDGNGKTELVSSPAQASLTGLDGAHNAVVGSAVTASLTDSHAPGTITYQWLDDGVAIANATHASYTPTTADLGKVLDVVVGFTDGGTVEHVTALAGTVHTPPAIVSETDPSTETVILAVSPTVLAAGVITDSFGLQAETFDDGSFAHSAPSNRSGHGDFTSTVLDATFTSSGDAGVVHGSTSDSAPPFVGPSPGHLDATNYLSIGANATETITFGAEQNEFGLYWGSVDSFNTIKFYDGSELVASYTGADIAPLLANGGQGSFASNGYVEFSDLAPFTKVVLGSGSSNAFEIDNVSAGFVSDSHAHLASPITGTMTVSDSEVGDTLTASVTGDAVVDYNGSTHLPSGADVAALTDASTVTFDSPVQTNGGSEVLDWTYNPGNANFDFLEPGDKLTLTFNAQVTDGQVTVGDQPLTVTVIGGGSPTTGSAVVNGTAQNDTFVNVGGGVTIFGKGGSDTFVFNKNFGSATISDFDVNHDTIDIHSDQSLLATVTALLNSAQSVNGGHDTILTDAAHDKITLLNVTPAQIQAHASDFHLV